jgi:hypothetical protein
MQLFSSYGIVMSSAPFFYDGPDVFRFEVVNAPKLLAAFNGGYPVLQDLLDKGGMFYINYRTRSAMVSRRDLFVDVVPAEHELQKQALKSLDKQADEEFELLRREVVALVDHLHQKEKHNVGE